MALHLVGESLDRHRAHARAEAGALIRLMRGVYVDAQDDIDRTVLKHALRIAAYLYPRAYLSGPSALTLGPTADGRLFLSGRRNQRRRIRTLEIIQNVAPNNASTIPALVGDDMGEMALTASSPLQRFLEAFRRQSEHAGAIDPGLRRRMADRLLAEYGDVDQAADALWRLARALEWRREADAAEVWLRAEHPDAAPGNAAAVQLVAAWHGVAVGRLTHDGLEWRWTPTDDPQPPLVRPTRPGRLPPFIESLLPEGWLAKVLDDRDERETLRTGRRYMSNMVVVDPQTDPAAVIGDVREGRLAHHQTEGVFTGRYLGPARRNLEDSFQASLARLFASPDTPRLSGVQIKAPMCLRIDGDLVPATEAPFTHILKPAGTNGFEHLPDVEWICLALAREAGFRTPATALVPMPDGMRPALLVERFDIRRSGNDTRRLAMEDFCSVLELPAARKYDGTIERMARNLRPLSTDPAQDLDQLFRRALFAWMIADGDMHLKNLALLKVAEAGSTRFDEVRLAPVYDAVATRVFPGLAADRMALTLSGKDDRLEPGDFLTLARTIELPVQRAKSIMADCARRLFDAAPLIAPPALLGGTGERLRDQLARVVRERAEPFL